MPKQEATPRDARSGRPRAFSHACARMNSHLQRELARIRRIEQHQQTTVNWLNPPDQSPLVEGILAAEMRDRAGWERLIDLARHRGFRRPGRPVHRSPAERGRTRPGSRQPTGRSRADGPAEPRPVDTPSGAPSQGAQDTGHCRPPTRPPQDCASAPPAQRGVFPTYPSSSPVVKCSALALRSAVRSESRPLALGLCAGQSP
jgi:hypothetical protein